MTKRKIQPAPQSVTIQAGTELIVTAIGIDAATPLARGPAKLSRIGHARVIDVMTTKGMIRVVVKEKGKE